MSSVPHDADREAAQQAQEVTRRAIRRLDILEGVIFALGALLAMGGGAVVAWIVAGAGIVAFRPAWIAASLILFIVPGTITIMKIRRDARAMRHVSREEREDDDG